MKHHALQLYDYHVWANTKICQHLKTLPQSIYEQEMQNVFPSISKTLAHIYITDAVWLSTMRESSFKQTRDMAKQLSSELEGKSLEETEVMFLGLTPEYTAFFAHQVDLDQSISL
ncbi:DinB family protein [Bacillus chungangensis]|uniref:Damage-inducible protein DinB n=1 Tax=Bacillus chungangensis TaxID=587633 RepID=A0ABT9WY43_9BACI|nr:DinB family protein [Bacillus chungangensis]MDQ0178145.1 putative damage-inducible protein DinB [Bacillus chungangensis]